MLLPVMTMLCSRILVAYGGMILFDFVSIHQECVVGAIVSPLSLHLYQQTRWISLHGTQRKSFADHKLVGF